MCAQQTTVAMNYSLKKQACKSLEIFLRSYEFQLDIEARRISTLLLGRNKKIKKKRIPVALTGIICLFQSPDL